MENKEELINEIEMLRKDRQLLLSILLLTHEEFEKEVMNELTMNQWITYRAKSLVYNKNDEVKNEKSKFRIN